MNAPKPRPRNTPEQRFLSNLAYFAVVARMTDEDSDELHRLYGQLIAHPGDEAIIAQIHAVEGRYGWTSSL